MNHPRLRALALAAAFALGLPAAAQGEFELDESSPVRRILPVGADGGEYYQVDCKNRQKGSVEVYSNPNRVCATPPYADQKCLPAWPIEDAAAHVCQ